jgi:hypothetical protein
MHVLYYASMLWCWHLIWILIRTDHPCLGVGCHSGRGSRGATTSDAQCNRAGAPVAWMRHTRGLGQGKGRD